jgi:hypothetical protein
LFGDGALGLLYIRLLLFGHQRGNLIERFLADFRPRITCISQRFLADTLAFATRTLLMNPTITLKRLFLNRLLFLFVRVVFLFRPKKELSLTEKI